MHPFTFIFFGALASALPLSAEVSPGHVSLTQDSKTSYSSAKSAPFSGININGVVHYARNYYKALLGNYQSGNAGYTKKQTPSLKTANGKNDYVGNTNIKDSTKLRDSPEGGFIAENFLQARDGSLLYDKENTDSQNGLGESGQDSKTKKDNGNSSLWARASAILGRDSANRWHFKRHQPDVNKGVGKDAVAYKFICVEEQRP